MSELRCRPVALLMLVLFLGSCTTWHSTTVSPHELIENERPAKIRVQRTDGVTVAVDNPSIRNDSIAATEECPLEVLAAGDQVCFPTTTGVVSLDEIAWLEVPRVTRGSGLAVMGAMVIVVMLVHELTTACIGSVTGECK